MREVSNYKLVHSREVPTQLASYASMYKGCLFEYAINAKTAAVLIDIDTKCAREYVVHPQNLNIFK